MRKEWASPSLPDPARAIASIPGFSIAIVAKLACLDGAIATAIVACVGAARSSRASIASLDTTHRRATVSFGRPCIVTLLGAVPNAIAAHGKGVHIGAHCTPQAPPPCSLHPDAALDTAVGRQAAKKGHR